MGNRAAAVSGSTFTYTRGEYTDIRKTFERVRSQSTQG